MLEDIGAILKTMQIEEPSIDDEIQPIETVVESESATAFKGFEALYNIVLDINYQWLCSNVQTKARQTYDEVHQSFEQNVNKLTSNVKRKKCTLVSNDPAWHVQAIKTEP